MKEYAEIRKNRVLYRVKVPDDFDPATAPVRMVGCAGHDPLPEAGWHCDDDGVMTPPTQAELDAEAAEQAEQEATTTELKNSTLATVTIAQAEQYIKNNFDVSQFDIDSITDLESARVEMRKMVIGFERMRDMNIKVARMLIAMRNKVE